MDKVNRFHCLVKWDNIYKSREQGGLGVKDLSLINQYLLAKWAWKYLQGSTNPW